MTSISDVPAEVHSVTKKQARDLVVKFLCSPAGLEARLPPHGRVDTIGKNKIFFLQGMGYIKLDDISPKEAANLLGPHGHTSLKTGQRIDLDKNISVARFSIGKDKPPSYFLQTKQTKQQVISMLKAELCKEPDEMLPTGDEAIVLREKPHLELVSMGRGRYQLWEW